MSGYRFDEPWMLLALALPLAVFAWRRWRGGAYVWIVPYAAAWRGGEGPRFADMRCTAVYVAIALLAVAAARPQKTDAREEVTARGYDLMLSIDLSTSMLAEDYTGPEGPISRLEAIRPVIRAFITGRPADRIGVVVFAGKAYLLSPLTTDHHGLEAQVDALSVGIVEDGTAIGDGLGIALTGLEAGRGDESAVGAFAIVLTDGANNSGALSPPGATAIAQARGVPVYTVGAGRNGMAPFPVFDDQGRRAGTRQRPSSIDEDALRTIATRTGGRYFKADDSEALATAFAAIDDAQTTEFQVRTLFVTTELFLWPALPALALLLWAALGGGSERTIRMGRPAGP